MKTVKGSLLIGLLLLPAAVRAMTFDCSFVKTDIRDDKHGSPSITFNTNGGTRWDLRIGAHHFTAAMASGRSKGQVLEFTKPVDDHAEQEQQTTISFEKSLFDPAAAAGVIEVDVFRTVDTYDRELKLTRTLGGWEYMDTYQCRAEKDQAASDAPSP